ncbi:MAG: glycosyltransferase family 39 protein [Candidatus Eremiobacteraeota bacterium]|nr:glycosyltransferase family 39 protein [Candidatus Eremiobacteraeota bacterium]
MKREQVPWLLAGITLVIHAIGNPHYGFFRDELYFIICGRHPAWGYVDQPPLTPLLAAGTQLFGHSLFLLRLVPAICAAATVYITCLLVIEMGGGSFAMILGSIGSALAPVLIAFGSKQGPDMLEMPLWPLAALFVLRVTNGRDVHWWLAAGLTIGIAFQSKYSVVFFAVALLAGLLISPQRAAMANKWFWAACGIAILIALPNVLWQAHYGFPMVELLRNGQQGKNIVLSPVQYIFSQFDLLNPVLALIAIAGVVWLIRERALRWLAYGYLLLIAMMIATHGKHYYPASIYPILFAAGGCALEAWCARVRILRPVIAAVVLLFGLVSVPAVLPILPTNQYIAYARTLHIGASTSEHHKMRSLPQDYADMHGWPEMAAAVAAVYQKLPPADRARAAIIADNYGEAAAIDFFGEQHGLPPALSGHNQYFLWGPRGYDGSVVIKIPGNAADMHKYCARSFQAAVFSNPLGMAYEDNAPIFVCYGVHPPLQQLWPLLKDYN